MRASLGVLMVVLAMAAGALRAGEYGSAAASDILAAEQKLVQAHKASQESINRLQQNVIRANAVLDEADAAFQAKTYDVALKKYREVVAMLPNPAPAVATIQNRAYDGIAASLLILARVDVEAGRLDDARAKCDEALAYAPKDERVRNERRDIYALMGIELDEYGRAIIEDNPAITPKFLKDVVDVRHLLQEGSDYLATGQYAAAEAKYKSVLGIDPYNKEAREKMREVVGHKMRYATKARESTRAEAMVDVDSKWEMPVLRDVEATTEAIEGAPISRSNVADVEARLRRLIVPRVMFEGAQIDEVAMFLRQQVAQLEPGRTPLNFIPRIDEKTPKSDVTLSLDNVPMYDVIKYAAQVANLKFRIEEYAVLFLPLTETGDQLISREYRLQPSFLSAAVSADQAAAAQSGRGRGTTRRSLIETVSITRDTDIKAYLEGKGVAFPPGSQIVFSPIANKLLVRNTPENLELIDLLVGGTEVIPQVEIATKFVEFNQEDLDELSIAMNVVAEGGAFSENNYTSAYPDQSQTFPWNESNGGINHNNMDGLNNLDGLRSSLDLKRSSLDQFLTANTGAAGLQPVYPNNFNFMATVFGYKVDTMIRALAQKKGTDLLSAPKVVARSGENAKIKVIRRFWYPTAFEAPELPSESGGNTLTQTTATAPVVTPANPTDFEEKELGVILDVRPQVGPDNYTVDMDLVPRVTEFEGFVNYGTPIEIRFEDADTRTLVLSENTINQPVFNSREIKTSVKVYDGQTLVLGGLIREDTQVFNDKVPFFGDLPLFGRLFRSKVEQTLKKNLMIFVTPTLVTPSGELVNPPEPIVLPDKVAAQR